MIKGIIKTLKSKPDEKWLLVVHKPSKKVKDIAAEISRALPHMVEGSEDERLLNFLTWGKHKAINKFSQVRNVMLAGTLFLRPSQYEARKHLASGEPVTTTEYSKQERRAFEIGEHKNDILQALCRGSVRLSRDDACAPCDAYIIASVRSGIPGALPELFPDCRVSPWQPLPIILKGYPKASFEMLQEWVATAKPGDHIRFTDIYKTLDIPRHDFNKLVRRHSGFVAAIAQLGIVEWGPKQNFTGFKVT